MLTRPIKISCIPYDYDDLPYEKWLIPPVIQRGPPQVLPSGDAATLAETLGHLGDA